MRCETTTLCLFHIPICSNLLILLQGHIQRAGALSRLNIPTVPSLSALLRTTKATQPLAYQSPRLRTQWYCCPNHYPITEYIFGANNGNANAVKLLTNCDAAVAELA